MAGILPVVLGSRTIDVTSTYSPASVQAGAAIVITQDSGTPAGDPVVVTLSGLQIGGGANLFAQNGATLIINSMITASALSSISIGDNATVVVSGGLSVAAGLSSTFTGRNATLSIPGSSTSGLPPVGASTSGFSASDIINFSNVAAATSATYANGTLSLLNGTTTVGSLALTGSFGVGQLAIQSDGHGGYNVGDNVGRVTYKQSGNMSQYDGFVSGPGSYVLNPATSNGDSVLSPTQDSTIGFSDGIELVDPNGTASQIARLYKATLGRAPDLPGLTFWDTQVTLGNINLSNLAYNFVYSPEMSAKYGVLSPDQFVSRLYTNLGLTPDVNAQQAVAALNAGAAPQTVTLGIVNSAAAIVSNMGTFGDNSAAEVYRLFQAGLGRDPGASGYGYFIPQVQSGMAIADIANEIIYSPEAIAKYGVLSDQNFISQVYQNVLGRAIDPVGQQITNNAFSSGVSRTAVFMSITDSPEARILTGAVTHQGLVTAS